MKDQSNFNEEVIRLIKQQMFKKNMNLSELGRRLNLSAGAANRTLSAKTFTLDKLKELSLVLEYNFFSHLASLLDLPEPERLVAETEKHTACNERIRELEIENRTLLKIIKDSR